VSGILVVTDSNVCLPRALTERLAIQIVPIAILLTDVDRADDSVDPELVFAALARDETVKSSPPSVLDYLTAVEHGDADSAIVLTPAAEFTSMYRNALEAAQLSTRPVRVVDTRTAAGAQGLVVEIVAEAARGGTSLDDVERLAHDAARRTELVAALDRVATIEHSGRIPSPVLATVQSHRAFPIFRFENGAVEALDTVLSDPLDALRATWERDGGPDAAGSVVFHAGAEARALELRARLRGDEPVRPFSPAMAVHTGPGVVGVAWLRA
jgi:DegV family protein with EDD domain